MRILSVRPCSLAGVLTLLVACSSQSATSPKPPTLQLTSAQAQAMTQRLQQIAASNPGISDLADSIMVGIQAGVGVSAIDLSGDLGAGPFYAFGLKRVFSGAPGFGPEFDVLAFDNPSDPQTFMILDVFASGSDAASGSFDGSSGTSATGFVFQVSGDSSLTWAPMQGVVSVAGDGPNGGCGGYQAPAGVTCAQETMHIAFNITSTVPEFGTGGAGPTAAFAGADVQGIVLTFAADSHVQ